MWRFLRVYIFLARIIQLARGCLGQTRTHEAKFARSEGDEAKPNKLKDRQLQTFQCLLFEYNASAANIEAKGKQIAFDILQNQRHTTYYSHPGKAHVNDQVAGWCPLSCQSDNVQ